MATRRLKGHDAIEAVDSGRASGELCKYTDPTEEARSGLSVEEARAIAKEDPSLIYVDTDDDVADARR
jgi:hypothetical protein